MGLIGWAGSYLLVQLHRGTGCDIEYRSRNLVSFCVLLVSVLPVLDVKAAVGATSCKFKIFWWFKVFSGIFKVVTVSFLDLQNLWVVYDLKVKRTGVLCHLGWCHQERSQSGVSGFRALLFIRWKSLLSSPKLFGWGEVYWLNFLCVKYDYFAICKRKVICFFSPQMINHTTYMYDFLNIFFRSFCLPRNWLGVTSKVLQDMIV